MIAPALIRFAFPALLLCSLAADDPLEIGFPVLAGFEWTEGMTLPAEVTKLDRQKVTISGFMRREDQGSGSVDVFMLVNDACGCQGTPKLNEIVFCAMPEHETTEVKAGTVRVTGTLFVGEQKEDDDIVVALYTLDVDKVE